MPARLLRALLAALGDHKKEIMKYIVPAILLLFSSLSFAELQAINSNVAVEATLTDSKTDNIIRTDCSKETKLQATENGISGPRDIADILKKIQNPIFFDKLFTYTTNRKCFGGELLVKLTINSIGSATNVEKIESTFDDITFDKRVMEFIAGIDYGNIESETETIAYIPIKWRKR